jgi:hypothetical protein
MHSAVRDQPSSITAPIRYAAFADPFDDQQRDQRWRLIAHQTAVIEGRGLLSITPAAVRGAGGGYQTGREGGWDLRGGAAMVAIRTAPAARGAEIMLRVGSLAGADGDRYDFIVRGAARLIMRQVIGGISSDRAIAYEADAHRFLRLRHDATSDTIAWETSPDGEVWTTRRNILRTIVVLASLIALRVENELGLLRDTTGTFSGFNTVRTPPRGRYTFGTLLSDPRRAADLREKGVRRVHLELGWNLYEPEPGRFSARYVAELRARIRHWREFGLRVTLGPGLQYPPGWALALPGARYVDQNGRRANELNLVFAWAVRERAGAYLARIHRDLDLNTFDAIRIGAGGNIELLYPDGRGQNRYWAYDTGAQGGAGRAASVAPCPFPGWQPGQSTITTAQAGQWYDWYLDALADAARWQAQQCRALGYAGRVELLMPGVGTHPRQLEEEIASHFAGSAERDTTPRGAAWHLLIARLHDLPGLVIYCSSTADGSGDNDVTSADDRLVPLDDARIERWSAARWLSYNADRYGLAKSGENPGRTDSNAYGRPMLDHALAQMVAGDWEGFYWAHEAELYAPDSGISAADYAAAIARYTGR